MAKKSKTKIEKALEAIETLDAFKKDVRKLYDDWQFLKLEVLGYTWGPYDNHELSETLCSHFYFEISSWDENFLHINYIRGGHAKLPTKWLIDPNWKIKAKEQFLKFTQEEMLKKLEK